jgi:hypothetical protein
MNAPAMSESVHARSSMKKPRGWRKCRDAMATATAGAWPLPRASAKSKTPIPSCAARSAQRTSPPTRRPSVVTSSDIGGYGYSRSSARSSPKNARVSAGS